MVVKSNRNGKWVPYHLSDVNKAARVTSTEIFSRHFKGRCLWDSVITSGEKSEPFGNPKRKKQWLGRGQEPELKPDIHGRKAIPCIRWSYKGVVHFGT
ncbi:hypothetical protein TELCIR_16424, partial [Teladorsagia circumcincta]